MSWDGAIWRQCTVGRRVIIYEGQGSILFCSVWSSVTYEMCALLKQLFGFRSSCRCWFLFVLFYGDCWCFCLSNNVLSRTSIGLHLDTFLEWILFCLNLLNRHYELTIVSTSVAILRDPSWTLSFVFPIGSLLTNTCSFALGGVENFGYFFNVLFFLLLYEDNYREV